MLSGRERNSKVNERQELYNKVKQTYLALLNRMAKRYDLSYQYVITDRVGYECTKIEEIFRPMWGIAPFLSDPDMVVDFNNEKISAADFLNKMMLDGTSQNSPRRFDRNVTRATEVNFANQATTEIAAYLITVHFAKEKLWDVLSKEQQDTIAEWVKKWSYFAMRDSWSNNHYWYPIFCIEILTQLGYDCSEIEPDVEKGYKFLEDLYYGNGWYSDGELGRFDYYEAWAHHTYTLLWILVADKRRKGYEEKCELYRQRSAEYLKYFAHYFDSDGGMAAYGRSIGYRFAAVAPFALAVMTGCDIDAGLCKNIVLKNINYFYEQSIPTEDGCFPVGYLYSAPGFGEGYASDGAISCYTEGYLCFLAGENDKLWSTDVSNLPISEGNYLLRNPLEGLQTVIAGNDAKNGVTLYNNALHYYQNDRFGHRFNDLAGAYSKFAYNSRSGFGLSVPDLVSYDNMIVLYTPDGTLVSHRRRILDNTIEDGMLISKHIPFSNDPQTYIKTWLIPLEDGWHARIHKVVLAQPYRVSEGGFSVGVRDDGYEMKQNTFVYKNYVSKIETVSDCEFTYIISNVQPGMHLLSPQALYPGYITEDIEAGEYIFASAVYFATDGKKEASPKLTINGNIVTVTQGDITKTVEV